MRKKRTLESHIKDALAQMGHHDIEIDQDIIGGSLVTQFSVPPTAAGQWVEQYLGHIIDPAGINVWITKDTVGIETSPGNPRLLPSEIEKDVYKNRPRRNALTDKQHGDAMRVANMRAMYFNDMGLQAKGSGKRDAERLAMENRYYYEGVGMAHATASDGDQWPVAGAWNPDKWPPEGPNENPKKNPKKLVKHAVKADGKWHKRKVEGIDIWYVIGDGFRCNVGPYRPRKIPASRMLGAHYEEANGQKVPKGTRWIAVAMLGRYGAGTPVYSAHKTLQAAKKNCAATVKRLRLERAGPSHKELWEI